MYLIRALFTLSVSTYPLETINFRLSISTLNYEDMRVNGMRLIFVV